MRAVSRSGTSSRPLQKSSSARICSIDSTGTCCSGTNGGEVRAIGETSISSSATIHFHHCWNARYAKFAVDADRVSIM